jgi:hypothetical protein
LREGRKRRKIRDMAAPAKMLTPEQAEPLIRAAVKGKGTFALGQIADSAGAPAMQVFSVLEKMVAEGSLRRLTDGKTGATARR